MAEHRAVGLDRIKHLEIALGNECNQRCAYCYQEDQHAGHEIPAFIWRERLLPVYPHLEYITIIGGEPTIMKNVRELVDFLGRDFPQIRLSTISNGQRFDDFWQETFLRRGRKVSFSVNAATAATHRRFVGGSRFDDTVANIGRLAERRRQENSPLQIHAGFVVTRENHHEAADFIRLCDRLGLDRCTFNLDFVRNLTADHPAIRDSLRAALPEAAAARIGVVGLEEVLRQLGEPVAAAERAGDESYYEAVCPMPWQSLDIRKDCTVAFCNAAWLPLGNLRKKDIAALWNGSVAAKMRRLIAAGDYSMCKPDCTMNCNPRSGPRTGGRIYMIRRYAAKLASDPVAAVKKLKKRFL